MSKTRSISRWPRRKVCLAVCGIAVGNFAFAQVPPPPPRPVVDPRGMLPTAAEVLYQLRSRVTVKKDEAIALEQLLTTNLESQKRLMRSFGLDPNYAIPPNLQLSRNDARELNEALDDLMDELEDEADEVLSSRARSTFRNIVRTAASSRRTAINSLKR
ncbi:MAG: hypothetical protein AAF662_04595 [Pseudomonadota bacterium]